MNVDVARLAKRFRRGTLFDSVEPARALLAELERALERPTSEVVLVGRREGCTDELASGGVALVAALARTLGQPATRRGGVDAGAGVERAGPVRRD
jgi:hypothetical protein